MLITKFLFGILAIIVSKIIYKPIESIRDDFDINNIKSSFIQKAFVDNNSPDSVKSGETVDVITNKDAGGGSDKTKQEASNGETKVESTTTKEQVQVHHHDQVKEQSEPPKNSEEGTKQPETAENQPKDNSHQHQTVHSQAGHHGHKGHHSHGHHHSHTHGHDDEEEEDDLEDLNEHEEEDDGFHHSGKGHGHTSDHKTKGDSTHGSLESSKVEEDKGTGKPENSPKVEDNQKAESQQKVENEQKPENGQKAGETEKVESDQKTQEAKPANEPENKKEDVVEQQNNKENPTEKGPNKEETSPSQTSEQKTVVEEQTKVPEVTNEEKEAKKSENENKGAEENGTGLQQQETQEQTVKSESEGSNDQTQQVSVETKGGELGESQDNSQPSCTCEKEVKPHEQPESTEQADNSKEQNEGGTSVKAYLKAKSEAGELYNVNMSTLPADQTQKVEEFYKKPEANCSIDCSKSCSTRFQGPTQCFTQEGKGVTCSAFADSTSLTCSPGFSPCSTPLVTSLNSYTMKNGSEEVGTLEVMGSNFNKCTGLSLAPADGQCTRENLLHNLLFTSGKLNLDYNMEVGPGKMVFSNLKIQNGDYKVCLFQRHDENGSPGPIASILYKLLTYVNPTHSVENGSKTLLSVEVGSLKVSD